MSNNKHNFATLMQFLKQLTKDVLESSRVYPNQSVAGSPTNKTGYTLIRPGGRDCYPCFWVRDFAQSLECGLIPYEELKHAILLTSRTQAKKDWKTPSGSFVPQGAIADHIGFDAIPIYFPGGASYEEQGQPFGYFPSLDNHFFFIEMAWYAVMVYKQHGLLHELIEGISLLNRLEKAFNIPPINPETGLVECELNKRGVNYGFTDIVIQSGNLLFCSILRYRAALRMSDLLGLSGEVTRTKHYRGIATQIANNIFDVFTHKSGLLHATTGKSNQLDIWGSAFAVYIGMSNHDQTHKISQALIKAIEAGTIAWEGNIRHVPTNNDFSDESAWEETVSFGTFPKNTYQNGAYWNTPTGWICYAISQISPDIGKSLAIDYIRQLQSDDFRKGDEFGAPYECIHSSGNHRQNPVYLTSVTCPLAAFQKLGWI